MTDDRHFVLAIISFENKISRSLDYDSQIKQFVEIKVRKKRYAYGVNTEY